MLRKFQLSFREMIFTFLAKRKKMAHTFKNVLIFHFISSSIYSTWFEFMFVIFTNHNLKKKWIRNFKMPDANK